MAKVVSRSSNEVTMEVTVRLQGSLLDMEAAIREADPCRRAEAHGARARSEAVPDPLRWC